MGPLDIWERVTWMTSSLHCSVLPDQLGGKHTTLVEHYVKKALMKSVIYSPLCLGDRSALVLSFIRKTSTAW